MGFMMKNKDLTQLNGLSGSEEKVAEYLKAAIAPLPGILEMREDALGNLLVLKKGEREARRTVLLGAHMDEVGMLVTGETEDGLYTVAPVGGIDPMCVLGRAVMVNDTIPAVIGAAPVHLLSEKKKETPPTFDDLRLDVGDAGVHLLPGDRVTFLGEWTRFGNRCVTAKAIDDRFGCAALLTLLEFRIPYDTWFAFFAQEEVGARGSRAAAYTIAPETALIIDATTAADVPGVKDFDTVCRVGKGPVIPFMDKSTKYNRDLYERAFQAARAHSIHCQTKTRIAGGNDAGSVQFAKSGVRCISLSLPCRYLHTPSCVASLDDMSGLLFLARDMIPVLHEA